MEPMWLQERHGLAEPPYTSPANPVLSRYALRSRYRTGLIGANIPDGAKCTGLLLLRKICTLQRISAFDEAQLLSETLEHATQGEKGENVQLDQCVSVYLEEMPSLLRNVAQVKNAPVRLPFVPIIDY